MNESRESLQKEMILKQAQSRILKKSRTVRGNLAGAINRMDAELTYEACAMVFRQAGILEGLAAALAALEEEGAPESGVVERYRKDASSGRLLSLGVITQIATDEVIMRLRDAKE